MIFCSLIYYVCMCCPCRFYLATLHFFNTNVVNYAITDCTVAIFVCVYYQVCFFLVEPIVCVELKDPDNGKVFFYPGGTIAIFTCHSGFTTIGNPFLQCIDGKWNFPPPKCQPS